MQLSNKQAMVVYFLITIVILFSLYSYSMIIKLKNTEEFIGFYYKAITEYNNGVFDRSIANYDFNSWGSYYDDGYFFDSITFCVHARDYYVTSNKYYQNAISYFEEANNVAEDRYKELIDNYIKASNFAIDINWAKYEACEYYEVAADFYSKGFFESGNIELVKGNEKIVVEHDGMIKEYNYYLSKINVLGSEI